MKKEDYKEYKPEEAENTFLWIKDYIFTIEALMLLALGFDLKYFISNSSFDLFIASILVISALSIFLFYFLYLAIVFRGQIIETDLAIDLDYTYRPILYLFSILITFVLINFS